MSQQDDINRYLTMKQPDWISVSNPGSAAYDPGFVAVIVDAINKGLIASPAHCSSGTAFYNGPSISGKDKVS